MNARVNGHGAPRWQERFLQLASGPIPVESFVSPAYFEREREALFRKVWLMLVAPKKCG